MLLSHVWATTRVRPYEIQTNNVFIHNMKKYFNNYLLFFFIILLFFSCNNKEKKEKLEKENAKKALSATQIVGIGKIVPENDIIQLSSPVNGIVAKIYKKENDTVSIGTVILELEHHLEDAKLTQLNTEIATQAAQINVDAASVGEFEAKYNNAKVELQRLQHLLEKGAETQQAVDDMRTNLKTFQANYQRLKAVVVVSRDRLQETNAALGLAQTELNQKIITSPINGKILDLTVLVGGAVATAQPFAQISPQGKIIAICEIDELYAEKITVGQKGWIREVSAADTLSTGTVYFTSSFLKKKSLFTDQSGEKEDRRVRTIKILLDKPAKLLLNARVECVIDISK